MKKFKKSQNDGGLSDPFAVSLVRRPGIIVAAVVVGLLIVIVVRELIVNPNFRFDVVGEYLFDSHVLMGVLWTFILTISSMVFGVGLALVLAIMRRSDNFVLRGGSWFYVWFFRGTPVYMQLVFWGLVSVLWPTIVFGIPFGPTLFEVATSSVFSVGVCAVVGLSLNEAAYLSEIVRSGFASVDPGQIEAAASLGMSRNQIFTRITLPQALRIIVPPIGNETIAMLKTTSLVLAVPFAADLMFVTRSIGARLFLPIPLIITGAIWYLACTSILMLIQSRVEKHFGKGYDLKIKHSNQLTEIPSSTAHV